MTRGSRGACLLIALAIVWWAPVRANAQTPTTATPALPQIQTTGHGELRMPSDRATVMIGVESRASTAAAAAADNARRQRAVVDTLRSLGLSAAQIATENYSVSPEITYAQGSSQPHVAGFVVSNTVRVQVERIDDVGRIVDAALAKGANQISGLQFFSSRADSARREALSEAVADARADADAVARAAGGSVGQAIEITAEPNEIRPVVFNGAMARLATAAPTPIEPGQTTISVTVTVRWAFVPRR